MTAAVALERDHGLSVRVVSMHTLSPADADEIRAAGTETRAVVTAEEGQISGGLGGAVAEIFAESACRARFARIGLNGRYSAIVGDQAFLRNHYDMDAAAIQRAVLSALN